MSSSASNLRHRGNVLTSLKKLIKNEDPSSSTITSSDSSEDEKDAVSRSPITAAKSKATIIDKLFSSKEEDQYLHMHKILGITALVSYIYRYANLGEGDGNFGPNFHTLLFIVHHWLLNASAFIFHIPQRRIGDGGFRIWPEYRIHSLVFASRSLACMLLIWMEQETNQVGKWYMVDTCIVLVTCAAADYGSRLQGEHRSNTVRGTGYTDPYGKWFASEMQFQLTAICMVGVRRYTMHLTAVAVIQLNSFLMTLRRKNVASHEVLTAAYGVLLLGALIISYVDDEYSNMMVVSGTYGCLAIIFRMGFGMDKYVMWTLLGASLYVIRAYDLVQVTNNRFWCVAFVITKGYSIYLGLKKRAEQIKPGQGAVVTYVAVVFNLLDLLAAVGMYFWKYAPEES